MGISLNPSRRRRRRRHRIVRAARRDRLDSTIARFALASSPSRLRLRPQPPLPADPTDQFRSGPTRRRSWRRSESAGTYWCASTSSLAARLPRSSWNKNRRRASPRLAAGDVAWAACGAAASPGSSAPYSPSRESDRALTCGDSGSSRVSAVKLSDTTASEVGKAYGRTTYMSTPPFKPVPRGTEGAVSLEGTVAGIGASLFFAGVGGGDGQVDGPGL